MGNFVFTALISFSVVCFSSEIFNRADPSIQGRKLAKEVNARLELAGSAVRVRYCEVTHRIVEM